MASNQNMLELAFKAHQSGQVDQAELLYSIILKTDSKNPKALFYYGTLKCQLKKFDEATLLLTQAIGYDPKLAEAHLSLGNAYLGLEKYNEARDEFFKVLEIKPSVDAYNNLGVLMGKMGQYEEAIKYFDNALTIKPDFNSAMLNKAELYEKTKAFDKAIKIYTDAITYFPRNPLLYLLLGNIYKNTGNFEGAVESYQKALKFEPQHILALNNLGVVFKDLNRLEDSLACYDKILQKGNYSAQILYNKGLTLKEMGRYAEALQCYDLALKNNPQNAEAHFNMGQILLLMENFERAWPELEWRLKTPGYAFVKNYIQKKWEGQPLDDQSILIYGEQGIGDEIFYALSLSPLIEKARECFIECHPKLVSLFNRSFPKAKIGPRNLNGEASYLAQDKNINYQSPIASLMGYLKKTPASISSVGAYLKIDPQRQSFWKSRLNNLSHKLNIGLCWTTMASDVSNSLRQKSIPPLGLWEPIFKNQNINFISLQYGPIDKDYKFIKEEFGASLHYWPDLDYTNDLDEVASLMGSLNLVLSINSTVAYLAGGLGIETWVLSPYSFGREAGKDYSSLWQPNIKYYLQHSPGNWLDLLNRVGQNLAQWALKKG